MKLEELKTIEQLETFLSGTQAVAFSVMGDKDTCYRWIQGELVKFRYVTLPRPARGVVIRYLMKVSGYSRQQITRPDCPVSPTRSVTAPPAHGGWFPAPVHRRGYPPAGGDG